MPHWTGVGCFIGQEQDLLLYAGSLPAEYTPTHENPRGLKPAARNTETGNTLTNRPNDVSNVCGANAGAQVVPANGLYET
jgi:hypothetical protein